MNEFREALTIQGRVLLALMLRESRTRYGRRPLGYLWALVEPILHITLIMALFSMMSRVVPLGESMPMFLATGFLIYFGFRNIMSRTQGGYGSNQSLLSFPVVKVLDVFLGRALLELATWIAVIFILMTILIVLGHGGLPHDPLKLVEAVSALFLIGVSAGIIVGILSEFVPSLGTFLMPVQRILYFISGVFFLPDAMPPAIRDIIGWNPLLHGITLFRTGYYPGYFSHMLDVAYLWKFAAASVLIALIIERMSRKHIGNLD